MPYKPAICWWNGQSVSVYTRIPIFVCYAGRLVNTPLVVCHHGDWRVYTPSFLGVPGVTVGWPRTKGTASNEWVHSFCGFLPNSFIQDLCFWRTSHCHKVFDLSLWNAVCSTGHWSIIGRCFGACQRSSCAEERRPQYKKTSQLVFGCPDFVSLTNKIINGYKFFLNFHWK